MNRNRYASIFIVSWVALFIFISCAKEEKKGATAKPLPESGFKAEVRVKEIPSGIKRGEKVNAIIAVKNISDQTWPSKGDSKDSYRINLSYRLFTEAGEPVAIEGERTPLSQDLRPDESVELSAVLKAPDSPGKYSVRFDMVQEAVAWFGSKNKENFSKPSLISVTP